MSPTEEWLEAVKADRRTSVAAVRVAETLARHFRDGSQCQLSIEKIANESGVVSLTNVRDSLRRLRMFGWLVSEKLPSSARMGLVYRPLMSLSAAARAEQETAA